MVFFLYARRVFFVYRVLSGPAAVILSFIVFLARLSTLFKPSRGGRHFDTPDRREGAVEKKKEKIGPGEVVTVEKRIVERDRGETSASDATHIATLRLIAPHLSLFLSNSPSVSFFATRARTRTHGRACEHTKGDGSKGTRFTTTLPNFPFTALYTHDCESSNARPAAAVVAAAAAAEKAAAAAARQAAAGLASCI